GGSDQGKQSRLFHWDGFSFLFFGFEGEGIAHCGVMHIRFIGPEVMIPYPALCNKYYFCNENPYQCCYTMGRDCPVRKSFRNCRAQPDRLCRRRCTSKRFCITGASHKGRVRIRDALMVRPCQRLPTM